MVAAPLLLVTLLVLVLATVRTAQRPAGAVPDLDGYLRRWAATHDGYDAAATRLLRAWLALVHRLARPLASAGLHPDVVTAWTVWFALVAVVLAAAGGAWSVAGGLLVAVSGFGDALDGAVAALTGRATAWGYVLDSVADRCTEVLFLLAAWFAGAPAWLAVACGVTFGLLEYLRARAANVGADPVAVITVGERPQRVICCALAVGVPPALAVPLGPPAAWSLAVLLVLSVAGLVQVLAAVHGQLRQGR